MGGEGSISAMISSLKNNKLRPRDNKLGHLEYVKGVPIGDPLTFKNKMSEEELAVLVEKMKRLKRKNTIITISVFSIVLLTLFAFTISYIW